jgi:hypothetical protein
MALLFDVPSVQRARPGLSRLDQGKQVDDSGTLSLATPIFGL